MDNSKQKRLEELKNKGVLSEEEYEQIIMVLEKESDKDDMCGDDVPYKEFDPYCDCYLRYEPVNELPTELKGLNWGAFFLPFFWGIAHNTWVSLFVLVPCVGWVMNFILLFKGNEWGWKNRHFSSVGEFRYVQRAWCICGVIFFVLQVVAAIIWGAISFVIGYIFGTPPPSLSV